MACCPSTFASMRPARQSAPRSPIDKACTQKSSTGLDQNQPSVAHQVEIQSLRDSISRATSP